jgi:hypothetical protein
MRFALATAVFALALVAGCSKLDPKECDKIRGEAFDMVNKAQNCNGDVDCRQSEWPGCPKPISAKTDDAITPMFASFKKGQCEEPKQDCKEPPDSYCKQGLCVHREKSKPEGASSTPTDKIIVK